MWSQKWSQMWNHLSQSWSHCQKSRSFQIQKHQSQIQTLPEIELGRPGTPDPPDYSRPHPARLACPDIAPGSGWRY